MTDVRNESPTNILFTFFIPSGGVETLNRQRRYALSKLGMDCHFLYTQEGTGLQNNTSGTVFITKDDHEIKKILSKGNYAAIVVVSDLEMLYRIRTLGYEGPLIYEIQGLGVSQDYADSFLKKFGMPTINIYCDAILYPKTPHLIKAFETNFPNKRKYCFQNCFNTEDFHYRKLPKLPYPVAGWVGRLEENKNWRDYLMICAKLIRSNPSLKLWMFEDDTLSTPQERSKFEQVVERLNLKPFLTIHANQPHQKMADYFSMIGDSGGFLCSTSRVEGFGYAVLEAMVCRCPVLSSDSDGVKNFIQHNSTGKFFQFGNLTEAVREARELLENVPLRENIRGQGVKYILRNFAPGAYAENFNHMVKELRKVKGI